MGDYMENYNSVIEVYNKVLNGELKKFPYGFWKKTDNVIKNAIICTKYLINNILKWSINDIKKKLTISTFRKYKLYGMLEHYNNSVYSLLEEVYPNTFYPWELKCVPMGYWDNKSNRLKALRWFCLKTGMREDNIKDKLTIYHFNSYGLGALLNSKYNNSPYLALNELFPNKYKIWEVSKVSKGYWLSKENCRVATLWLIDKLNLSYDNLNETLTKEDFYNNGLGCMIKTAYKDSPYLAIYDISCYTKIREA